MQESVNKNTILLSCFAWLIAPDTTKEIKRNQTQIDLGLTRAEEIAMLRLYAWYYNLCNPVYIVDFYIHKNKELERTYGCE